MEARPPRSATVGGKLLPDGDGALEPAPPGRRAPISTVGVPLLGGRGVGRRGARPTRASSNTSSRPRSRRRRRCESWPRGRRRAPVIGTTSGSRSSRSGARSGASDSIGTTSGASDFDRDPFPIPPDSPVATGAVVPPGSRSRQPARRRTAATRSDGRGKAFRLRRRRDGRARVRRARYGHPEPVEVGGHVQGDDSIRSSASATARALAGSARASCASAGVERAATPAASASRADRAKNHPRALPTGSRPGRAGRAAIHDKPKIALDGGA